MMTKQQLDVFTNEPFTNFTDPAENAAMLAALAKVAGELGREYPIIIGSEEISLDSQFEDIRGCWGIF